MKINFKSYRLDYVVYVALLAIDLEEDEDDDG